MTPPSPRDALIVRLSQFINFGKNRTDAAAVVDALDAYLVARSEAIDKQREDVVSAAYDAGFSTGERLARESARHEAAAVAAIEEKEGQHAGEIHPPEVPNGETLRLWAKWMRANGWRGMLARVEEGQSWWHPSDFLEAVARELDSDEFEKIRDYYHAKHHTTPTAVVGTTSPIPQEGLTDVTKAGGEA